MTVGLKAHSEVPIHGSDGTKRWSLRVAADHDISLWRHSSTGAEVEAVLVFDWATGAQTGLGQSASVVQSIANDVIPTILASTRGVNIADSTTGNKAILTDTSGADAVQIGQVVDIVLRAATGNSYTLALASGTLTFNAAGESATIVRTAAGWEVVHLSGATVV